MTASGCFLRVGRQPALEVPLLALHDRVGSRVLASDHAPLLLEVGLKWPPEHYLRRKLEGLAASGMKVAVATSDGDLDAEMRLRGVATRPAPSPGRARRGRPTETDSRLPAPRLAEPPCTSPAVARGQANERRRRTTLRLLRSHLVVMLAKPDLVHFEWEAVAADFLPLLEACRCPVVVSSHGGVHVRPKIGDRRVTRAYPTIFARAAAVHCVSEAVREEAVRFGLDRGQGARDPPGGRHGLLQPGPERRPGSGGAARDRGRPADTGSRATTTRSKRWRRSSTPECR